MKFWRLLGKKIGSPFVSVWRMVRSTGITKRWLKNSFAVIMLVLVIIVFALSIFVRNYYYSNIEQGLYQRSSVTARFFGSTSGSPGDGNSYASAALGFVENFESKDKMELQILDDTGDIIISSTGFEVDPEDTVPDYGAALQSSSGVGRWEGNNSAGEHVMAVTRLLSVADGAAGGAVRFVVSLEPADSTVMAMTAALILIASAVLFFVLMSGSYFVSSIVEPVKSITASTNKIAKGDFDIRIESDNDDEIGNLTAAINSMAAELAASEKLKNDFISSVSHELRTPLTAIKGWGETLLAAPEDEGLRTKGMNVIIRESERLTGLVEDLLDFSRLQSGRMKMTYEKLDVIAEVSDAVYMFHDRSVQENKSLTFSESEQPAAVMGDRDRLRQVLVNIIDNAMKYSDPGSEIRVAAAVDGDRVNITVRDHGCGIAQDDLKLVTKRFYKANTTQRGFGIGLGVAEEIITLHQGMLRIESREGEGTLVTVSLPTAERFDLARAAEQSNG